MKNKIFASVSFVVGILLLLTQVATFVLLNIFKVQENQYFTQLATFFAAAAFIVLLIVVVVEFISLKFDKDSVLPTLFVSIFAWLMVIFDGDFITLFNALGINVHPSLILLFNIAQFLFFAGATISMICFFSQSLKIKYTKMELYSSICVSALAIVAYIVLDFFHYSFIALGIIFFIYLHWSIKCLLLAQMTTYQKQISFIAYLILTLIFGAMVNSSLSYCFQRFVPASLNSLAFLTVGLLFITIYLIYVIKTTQAAYKKEEAEKKIKELQTNILLKQMNPHFLFNSLNKIKTQYSVGVDNGNNTLDLLAKELRMLTESGEVNIVPLSKELDLVLNYVQLMNVDLEKPYDVIFDIENEDFDVPFFSIQTLIENAIKYSGINSLENGVIEIEAYSTDENNYVIVKDNGRGFDVDKIDKASHGLKNVKERLSLLLNGKLNIESNEEHGTIIKMTIPIKKEKQDENSNG